MDELEIQTRAAELLLIETLAFIRPEDLDDAERSIRAGMEADITDEERSIRLGALGLIEDARKRYQPPAVGVFVPKGPDAPK